MYVPPEAFVDAALSLCLKPLERKSIPVPLPKLSSALLAFGYKLVKFGLYSRLVASKRSQ